MKHLVALLLLLIAACGDTVAPAGTVTTAPPTTSPPTTAVAPAADEVVLEVHRGGGLCVDGPCSTTYSILGDGRVELDGVTSIGISDADLTALLGQLANGSGDLSLFTGTCPEAYDGPRYTYRFQGSEIDSCVSDVSGSELIRLIHSALDLGTPYG